MDSISADDRLVWDCQAGTRLRCTKTVIMEDDQTEAFSAGQLYVVSSTNPIAEPSFIRLKNNQGLSHKMTGSDIRQYFTQFLGSDIT